MLSAKWRPFCLGLNVLIQLMASNTLHWQLNQIAVIFVQWKEYEYVSNNEMKLDILFAKYCDGLSVLMVKGVIDQDDGHL